MLFRGIQGVPLFLACPKSSLIIVLHSSRTATILPVPSCLTEYPVSAGCLHGMTIGSAYMIGII